MAITTSKGKYEFFEDFMVGTPISTSSAAGVTLLNSSDAGNTAFAENAGFAGEGSARAATDASDNDMCELALDRLNWLPQNDPGMEVRMQFDVVTTLAFNVGFNDDALDDSNTLPVELSTTTFTTNAATWVGILYDVDATNDDLHAMWVDDDSDSSETIANLRYNGVAPIAATYGLYRVELFRGSSATAAAIAQMHAIVDDTESTGGRMVSKRFTSTVDGDAALVPHVGFENRDAIAHQCDVDYIHAWRNRASA